MEQGIFRAGHCPGIPEFAEARADLGGYYLNLWTAGSRPAKEIVLLVRAHARKRIDISDGSWLPVRAEEARATCANYYLSVASRPYQ